MRFSDSSSCIFSETPGGFRPKPCLHIPVMVSWTTKTDQTTGMCSLLLVFVGPHVQVVFSHDVLIFIIAPAFSRVRYRRPIFRPSVRPSVNIYVDVRHLCQS